MQKSSRILALMLSLALLVALFSACGDSGDGASPDTPGDASPYVSGGGASADISNPQTGDGTASASGGLYPISDEKITLSFTYPAAMNLLPYLDDDAYNNYPTVQHMEEVTNVHIDWYLFERDLYSEKFSLMLASEDYYDIIGAADQFYPFGPDGLVADDICIDLVPYLADYAQDFYNNVYLANDTYKRDITTDNGYVPAFYSMTEISSNGSMIRKDWLDKLNLNLPTTYDELYDVLAAFKTELGVKSPILMTNGLYYPDNCFAAGFDVFVFRMPGELTWQVDNAGVVSAAFMTPQYKEFLMLLNEWYEAGILGDDMLNVNNPGIVEEKAAANEVGFWASSTNSMSQSSADLSGDPGYNPWPLQEMTMDGSGEVEMIYVGGVATIGTGVSVSTQCAYPEAAVSYLNWAYTEEGGIWAQFGEENLVHTVNSDGGRSFTDLVLNNPDGLASNIALGLYTLSAIPYVTTAERTQASFTREAQFEAVKIWNQGRSNAHLYYGTLTSNETDQYTGRAGDLATLVDENSLQFVTGAKSFDEWDDFIARAYTLGIEGLTSVKQAAYNRYIAR